MKVLLVGQYSDCFKGVVYHLFVCTDSGLLLEIGNGVVVGDGIVVGDGVVIVVKYVIGTGSLLIIEDVVGTVVAFTISTTVIVAISIVVHCLY